MRSASTSGTLRDHRASGLEDGSRQNPLEVTCTTATAQPKIAIDLVQRDCRSAGGDYKLLFADTGVLAHLLGVRDVP